MKKNKKKNKGVKRGPWIESRIEYWKKKEEEEKKRKEVDEEDMGFPNAPWWKKFKGDEQEKDDDVEVVEPLHKGGKGPEDPEGGDGGGKFSLDAPMVFGP